MPPKFLAYFVVLWFETLCPKENTVARLKSKYLIPKILSWLRYWFWCMGFSGFPQAWLQTSTTFAKCRNYVGTRSVRHNQIDLTSIRVSCRRMSHCLATFISRFCSCFKKEFSKSNPSGYFLFGSCW